MSSIYNYTPTELAYLFRPFLIGNKVDYTFPSVNLALLCGFQIEDGCDKKRLSEAMSVLKRMRLVRWSRKYRQWQNMMGHF